jgi:hypothetical protein
MLGHCLFNGGFCIGNQGKDTTPGDWGWGGVVVVPDSSMVIHIGYVYVLVH